ncbi:MAG: hypothetical protein ABR583_05195 [Gaiellaceae bacterium]
MRLTPSRALAAAVIVLVAGMLALRAHQGRATEHRLSAVASTIAGRSVHVRCQGAFAATLDATEESGRVRFGADGRPGEAADLSRDVCRALEEWPRLHGEKRFACLETARRCEWSELRYVHALLTLAHESQHLAGERGEAAAECYALQSLALVARRLGSPPAQARAVARSGLAEIYVRMPGEYRSGECRNGGRLDLQPNDPSWP